MADKITQLYSRHSDRGRDEWHTELEPDKARGAPGESRTMEGGGETTRGLKDCFRKHPRRAGLKEWAVPLG